MRPLSVYSPLSCGLGRIAAKGCRLLFPAFILLASVTGSADITAEVTITDRSFPPVPEGTQLAMYDHGDGGECARATKVIGTVLFRITPPMDKRAFMDKANEITPGLLKAGAQGVAMNDVIVEKFSSNGYAETATATFSVLRFVGEPPLDLRSEADFKALFRTKAKLAPIEGIWLDQSTKQRVAFCEDPAQPGRFLGVQFDVGNSTNVPKGLVVADFRLKPDGWLVGHFTFDDYTRHPARLKMPAGDELDIPIKNCTNGCFHRAYPDKFPPVYTLINVRYIKETSK
jgi:hypothetical protein